ncbi:MAG TPA: 23S rRNA (guanosine(2251)-2'-O)-methyltransferase RlmB [Cytophagaceae bacterium]|jgi:23S rRNA (guanosine2251-2'-O)-methyltransferase
MFEKRPPIDKSEYIFGLRPIVEAILAGREIDKILVQKELKNDVIKELYTLATDHKIPLVKVPLEKLNRVTRKNHQGVIAFLSSVMYASLDNILNELFSSGKTPLFLILDRITDVRNFGAIARTAECCGAHAIILPSRGGAQINGDAVKTSAGALNYIPICREENLKNTITYLQDSGVQVVACSEKTDLPFYSFDLKGPLAIVLGSEEDGVSPEYIKKANATLKLPILGKIESLNVSVAAGMALYEVVRQRTLAS